MSDSTPTLEELNARLKENQQQIEQSTKSTTVSHHPPDWWSVQSAMTISAAVLLFGLLVLILAARYMSKASDSHIRLFATMLIVVMAVFLIVAGYSDTQIAPAFGLLGTIAGYLLGKDASAKSSEPTGEKVTNGKEGDLVEQNVDTKLA